MNVDMADGVNAMLRVPLGEWCGGTLSPSRSEISVGDGRRLMDVSFDDTRGYGGICRFDGTQSRQYRIGFGRSK